MDDSEKIRRFVHEKLSDENRAAFEIELEGSADLRAELALVTAVKTLTGDLQIPENMKDDAWDRLSQTIDAEQRGVPANDNRRFSLMHVASLAGAIILAWEFIAVPIWSGNDGARFTTASAGEDGSSLRVIFAQGADIFAITTLLRETGGTIVDGPSAIELYRVTFENIEQLEAAQAVFDENSTLLTVVSVP